MKKKYLLSLLMLSMSIVACARATPTPTDELTVPNIDADSPACVVKVPAVSPRCTPEGCTFSAHEGAALASIKLDFSCLPKSAPTGFEKPAPEVKVKSLRSKNAQGHFLLTDAPSAPPNERFRELGFCLYGKLNNFCGYGRLMSLEYRTKVKVTRTVKTFVQGIELQEPWTKDGR